MPNRILRDITDSEKVNSLSSQAEVLFYRLMMKADDYGCFHAKSSLIKAALFPLRLDSVRETDITRWLAECEKAGLIAFYEADSKPYLVIVNFGQRMRNMKKRFPTPPDNLLQLAATRGNSRPETRNEKLETETRNEKANDHSLTFNLEYFRKIGYEWKIPEELYSALDNFLNYRQKHPDHGPIKSAEQVEAIIRGFYDKKINPESAALMLLYTISRGAKNVIYELPKNKKDERITTVGRIDKQDVNNFINQSN